MFGTFLSLYPPGNSLCAGNSTKEPAAAAIGTYILRASGLEFIDYSRQSTAPNNDTVHNVHRREGRGDRPA
jgi:hypothetical protein